MPENECVSKDSPHSQPVREPDSEDEVLYLSPSTPQEYDSTKLRAFRQTVKNVMYEFRELKKNKGKIYKIWDNGTIHKRRSGTFKIMPNLELNIKWS